MCTLNRFDWQKSREENFNLVDCFYATIVKKE